MAVAKKDQERANYAWMYGAQARKDGKERTVPDSGRSMPMPGYRASTACRSAARSGRLPRPWKLRRMRPPSPTRKEPKRRPKIVAA